MLQIVFNEISAAEISQLDTLTQLDIIDSFHVTEESLKKGDYGHIEKKGIVLHRLRADEYRFYFEFSDDKVIVHRVLHRNTLSDFLYRSKISGGEDEVLSNSKHFWQLIDEGRNARKV